MRSLLAVFIPTVGSSSLWDKKKYTNYNNYLDSISGGGGQYDCRFYLVWATFWQDVEKVNGLYGCAYEKYEIKHGSGRSPRRCHGGCYVLCVGAFCGI